MLTICAMAYCKERSRPLSTRKRLNRKRFVRDETQKTAMSSATSKKIWTRLSVIPGRGAFHESGMPAALIALIVKKTKAATLSNVVTIALNFWSSLNRLKSRRTGLLCATLATIIPAAKSAMKAMIPSSVMWWPAMSNSGRSQK